MSTTALKKELAEQFDLLCDAIDSLRAELLRFKRASSKAAAVVAEGGEIVDALVSVGGPHLREDLVTALNAFQAQRRRTNVAMIALGQDQGESISEVGRRLGISRQMAARLAAE